MAFVKENPAHLVALKAEVANDPLALGYTSALKTEQLLALLKDRTRGGGTVNRPIEELDIPEIAGVIEPAEFDLLKPYDKIWLEMLINQPAEVTLKQFRAKFQDIFQGSVTLTAVLALRSRPASRAEMLFGVNTEVNRLDWIAARES